MSITGFITEKIFSALNLIPAHHGLVPHASHIGNNLTSWLDLLALLLSMAITWLYFTRDKGESSPYAKDPVCGMQVEKATAAAIYQHNKVTYYFCSPNCKDRFKSSVSI